MGAQQLRLVVQQFVNVARGGNAETEVGMRNATQGILTSEPFYVDENQVTIIDVPGFNDARLTVIEVLKSLSDLLSTLSSKNKITGFLYMHNITDTRVGGASLRNMNAFKTICGAESLKNAVYVTNMWSDPPTQNQLKREEELRESDDFFGWPLSQGAQMARHTNTKESAHNIIRLLLPKQPTVTKLWKQLVDERLGLAETDVGHVFEQEFKQDGLYQQQLKELADLKGKAAALEDEDRFKRQDGKRKTIRIWSLETELSFALGESKRSRALSNNEPRIRVS
ncbi:hypothetical protein B0J17DRAFT_577073 [Rhizoctonia solani]|nr:hypothetical protein B0J17DRAFT_577073 [Rhizoctonia solani]